MLVVSAGVHVLSAGQKVSIYRDKYSKAEPVADKSAPAPGAGLGTANAATR